MLPAVSGRESKRYDRVALVILVVGVLAAGLVRIPLLPYDSIDMIGHLKHWYDYIVLNGFFGALSDNFADYTPGYLALLAFVALIRERWLTPWLSKTTTIKLPSIAFDFALAVGVYGILRQLGLSQRRAALGAVLCLLLPTVVLNSAMWGQAVTLQQLTRAPAQNGRRAEGRWIGMLRIKAEGRRWLEQALTELSATAEFPRASVPDLLNLLVRQGKPIHVWYVHGHWLDINSVGDLATAGIFTAGQG